MTEFLTQNYDVLRALHIIAMIAWMSGIMYLPRLYAYHVKAGAGSEIAATFATMERKLLRIIMNPAMILTWIFGLTLIQVNSELRGGWGYLAEPWMLTKIAGILFITAWHHVLSSARKKIAAGTDTRSERFWRATNELPFLAAIAMVVAVTTEFARGRPLF